MSLAGAILVSMVHKFHGDSWGLAPGARNWRRPLQVNAPDPADVHTTKATIPLWTDLTYADGGTATVKAFALGWTDAAVRIQRVEKSLARYVWVDASKVRRRVLERK